MSRKGSYIFTAKRHPEKGIMSTILGVISIVSLGTAVYLTSINSGEAMPQYGAVGFLTTLFAFAGIILGVMARMEKDKFHLFSYMGIMLNFLALAMISTILYAGAYGI